MRDKSRAIEELEETISKLQQQVDRLKRLIPDDLPDAFVWSTDHNLRVSVPFSWPMYRQTRARLDRHLHNNGMDGWVPKRHALDELTGDRYIYFYAGNAELCMCMRPDMDKSVCTLVQTGIKTVPTYEVVCND